MALGSADNPHLLSVHAGCCALSVSELAVTMDAYLG